MLSNLFTSSFKITKRGRDKLQEWYTRVPSKTSEIVPQTFHISNHHGSFLGLFWTKMFSWWEIWRNIYLCYANLIYHHLANLSKWLSGCFISFLCMETGFVGIVTIKKKILENSFPTSIFKHNFFRRKKEKSGISICVFPYSKCVDHSMTCGG